MWLGEGLVGYEVGYVGCGVVVEYWKGVVVDYFLDIDVEGVGVGV